jgi:large subunit ribosomal protein L1
MSKLTKNQKAAIEKVEKGKAYRLSDAAALLKEITFTKFDASVDIDVRLGVDPRKSNQMVRGVVTLPHGTGKTVRVLVLCTPDKEAEAKEAGADYYGLDEYVEKIKAGWTDVDVIITTPNVMGKVGALGRILGPRGLMPNPKTGTVTMEIGKAVKEVKAGKIDFRVDKFGIVHSSIGKVSFTPEQITDNAIEFVQALIKLKQNLVDLKNIVLLLQDEVLNDHIEFTAVTQGKSGTGDQILGFLQIQLQCKGKGDRRGLGWLIARIVADLGKVLLGKQGFLVDLRILLPALVDQIQKGFRKPRICLLEHILQGHRLGRSH